MNYLFFKRFADLFFGVLILLITSPLIISACIIINLSSPGPCFSFTDVQVTSLEEEDPSFELIPNWANVENL